MRALIVADIHSNLPALEAVFQDAAGRGPLDAVWCTGDVVGYGPDPNDCVSRLQEAGARIVAGNHDLAAAGRISTDAFNPAAARACQWTAAELTPEHALTLAALPLTLQEEGISLVHGSPADPIWEYLVSIEQADENFDRFEGRICLLGHSHLPIAFQLSHAGRPGEFLSGFRLAPGRPLALGPEDRLFYNPGSVGQPRDGDPRAAYAVYDDQAATLTHFRVEYDIPSVQRRMREAGLPESLASRLSRGR